MIRKLKLKLGMSILAMSACIPILPLSHRKWKQFEKIITHLGDWQQEFDNISVKKKYATFMDELHHVIKELQSLMHSMRKHTKQNSVFKAMLCDLHTQLSTAYTILAKPKVQLAACIITELKFKCQTLQDMIKSVDTHLAQILDIIKHDNPSLGTEIAKFRDETLSKVIKEQERKTNTACIKNLQHRLSCK
jgi:uncharacterized phage infection (PIP) family protein YhgE